MVFIANKPELKFRFHNPNKADETAEYILKVLLEANKPKLETALESAVTGETTEDKVKIG